MLENPTIARKVPVRRRAHIDGYVVLWEPALDVGIAFACVWLAIGALPSGYPFPTKEGFLVRQGPDWSHVSDGVKSARPNDQP